MRDLSYLTSQSCTEGAGHSLRPSAYALHRSSRYRLKDLNSGFALSICAMFVAGIEQGCQFCRMSEARCPAVGYTSNQRIALF